MRNGIFSQLFVVIAAATVGMTVLSGCANEDEAGETAAAEQTTAATTSALSDTFLCQGLSITREALEARVPVSEANEAARIALSEATWDDDQPLVIPPDEGWYVVSSTEKLVSIMRDTAVDINPDNAGVIARDHETMTVEWVGDATNLEPGWYVSRSSECALTVDLGDVTVPSVTLQALPDPASNELRLLVTEQSCNSGKDAAGRVEVVSLVETDEQVTLVLGVRPRGGFQDCPGHPATPFTIVLSAPLGEREVVDAGLVEPRLVLVSE